jgi:hypothetical protein
MIEIKEVLEEAARVCDSVSHENPMTASDCAAAIRALAAKYEGCIVAEDTVIAWKRSVEFAGTGMGAHIPHDVEIPLYRSKEPK